MLKYCVNIEGIFHSILRKPEIFHKNWLFRIKLYYKYRITYKKIQMSIQKRVNFMQFSNIQNI